MSMTITVGRALLFTMIGVLGAAACSASGDSYPSDSAEKLIGQDGGTLIGPGGATLVVPPHALSAATRLSITRMHLGYPELVSEMGIASSVFAFQPHGQTFAEDVTIRIPYGRGTNDVQLVSAPPGGEWSTVDGTAQDGVAQAQSRHFSFYAVIVAPASDSGAGEGGSGGIDNSAGAAGSTTSSGGDHGDDSSAGTGGTSAGTGGASAGTGGTSAGTGGTSAGTGGTSAGTGGTSAGTGGTSTSGGTGGAGANAGGGSAGTGGGAKVCMAPVANAPTGTSGLASYPKGIARLSHRGSGNKFTTTLSLQFSTVDQCGYVMAGTMKNVEQTQKELTVVGATAEPPVTVGTYQPIAYDNESATGFTEGGGDCMAGAIGDGEENTTLVITSISETRVSGMVKRGSVTEQTFDVPICASQVAYCGCVP